MSHARSESVVAVRFSASRCGVWPSSDFLGLRGADLLTSGCILVPGVASSHR